MTDNPVQIPGCSGVCQDLPAMADLHYGMIWQNLAEPGIVWQNLAALANSGSLNQPAIDLEMGQISSGDKSNLVTSDVKLVR